MKNTLKTLLENPFETATLLFFVGLAFTVLVALTSDHTVRCNYLDSNSTEIGVSYRVMNDLNWMEDRAAITTPDLNVALEVLSTMKQCSSK